jgi:hypothetical protein
MLNKAGQEDDFRGALDRLVETADLKPKEREAVQWLLDSIQGLPVPANESRDEDQEPAQETLATARLA